MTTPRGRRGPYAKTRGRLDLVGRTAYELVLEVGHRQVTLSEVARRAGLTEAQVLYRFPSRDHLLVAALEHSDAVSDARSHPEEPVPADPATSIADAVNAELSDPRVLRLFLSMSAESTDPEHPAHAWMARRTERTAHAYTAYLRRLQADGWAHPEVEPERFARQFKALWDGLQAQWLVSPTFDLGAEVAAGLRALATAPSVAPAAGGTGAGRHD